MYDATAEARISKPWYKSTTIQGAILTSIGTALLLLQVSGVLSDTVFEILSKYIGIIANLIGVPVTMYGRVKSNGEALSK